MKLLASVTLVLLVLLTQASAATAVPACPRDRLTALLDVPRGKFKIREVEMVDPQSAEGGTWRVFLRAPDTVHAIQQRVFGETGQVERTLVFIDARTFAIRSVLTTYKEPIGSPKPVVVAARTTADYVFCDGAYVLAPDQPKEQAAKAANEAAEMQREFFGAKEISRYLPRQR